MKQRRVKKIILSDFEDFRDFKKRWVKINNTVFVEVVNQKRIDNLKKELEYDVSVVGSSLVGLLPHGLFDLNAFAWRVVYVTSMILFHISFAKTVFDLSKLAYIKIFKKNRVMISEGVWKELIQDDPYIDLGI